MCTATYFKDRFDRIVFTTNRDEHAARPTKAPNIYHVNGERLLFPKDELAGGTWVAVNEKAYIACMMNGAEGEHEWLGTTAQKSRGQVLLDSFQFKSAHAFLEHGDFEAAHPFSLLLIKNGEPELFAIKWNGSEKWIEKFDADVPHIWSAHTLYPEEQRNERLARFQEWSKDTSHLQSQEAFQLHQSSKASGGLLLENSNQVNTVSVTQLLLDDSKCKMHYYEIQTQEQTTIELPLV